MYFETASAGGSHFPGGHGSASGGFAGGKPQLRNIGEIGELLGHGRRDEGRTAKPHYIGAPEEVPALRAIVGGREGKDGDEAVQGALDPESREEGTKKSRLDSD